MTAARGKATIKETTPGWDCLSFEERARAELSQVQLFYLWGGMNYESMAGLDKWMMSVFRKMLASKKNPTQEDKLAAQMVAASFDKADRKYLVPLEEYLTR